MADIPQDIRKWIFGRGAKHHGRACVALLTLAVLCLVMGIVSDILDRIFFLETANWFYTAVVFSLLGTASWLTAYGAAKEGLH